MSLFINTNTASLEAQRNLASSQMKLGTSFQRLSSGMRINTAADDAAGLAVSDQMEGEIRGYSVAERNTNNAISMAQTADGALGQISSMLQRMRELAVQGSNGDMNATDRGFLDTEYTQLKSEVDRVSATTQFNGTNLLSGAVTTIDFQVGVHNAATDRLSVAFGGVDTTSLGLAGSSLGGATAANSQAAIDTIDAAMTTLSTDRANFGASLNRMQVTVANLQSMSTNLTAANSRIRDVDVAMETATLSKNQVLVQAGVSILAQANQSPQLAMKLLGG